MLATQLEAKLSLETKQSSNFTTILQEFHDKCARQPQEEMTKAKKKHTYLMREIIEKDLRYLRLCQRLEFTGSSYEGVKVNNDIEFDVMFIISASDVEAKPLEGIPGFAKLRPNEKMQHHAQFHDILDSDKYAVAEKVANKFLSNMQILWNNREELQKNRLSKHGPAVQMDVTKEDGSDWYSVDLTPCYELTGGERFVARKVPDGSMIAWRRTFSVEEKKHFDGMDASNGCRKQCLRILKVIRNNEATFQRISSYHLKNTLFHEAKEHKNGWSQENIGTKFMDLLRRLSQSFLTGKLPNFFNPEVNLLENIPPETLKNMHCRCERLINNEARLIKLLETIMGLEKYNVPAKI